MPVEVMEQPNVATLGAAMFAAVGVGVYRTLGDAAVMARIRATHAPRPACRALYDGLYAQYRALYAQLTPVFAEIDAVRAAATETDSPEGEDT